MILTESRKPEGLAGGVKEGTDDWFIPWRFVVMLGGLIAACFPLVVLGLKTFAYLDFGQFAYPVAFYHRESFWRGELPFWNPLSDCGIPFLAQWNTLTLYPPSLFYLVLPFPWSLGMFCLLHLVLAGAGMYVLAYKWTGNRLAGAAAGSVYAFNGLTWYGLIWPHISAALAWMPWVVLAMGLAWHRGGRFVIWAALAAGLQLLSGGAEVIILTWLLLAVLWAGELAGGDTFGWGKNGTGETGPTSVKTNPWWKPNARLAGAVLLGTGLAAVQLLPFLDLLAHSQRTTGSADPGMGVMPLSGWANYLLPVFHYIRNPQGLYVPPNHWTGSYYLGIGTVLLALFAVWRARSIQTWLLAGLTLLGLVLALGGQTPLYGFLTKALPFLGLIRFPVKFVILATFILPLLAARGLACLQSASAESWTGEWRRFKWLALLLLGAMGLVLAWAWRNPLAEGHVGVTTANGLIRAVFLVALVVCLAALRKKPRGIAQVILQSSLVLLLWADVLTHNSNLSPTVSPAVMEANTIRQYFNWGSEIGPGASRIMQSTDSYQKMLAVGFRNLEVDTNGRRLAQFFNFNLLDNAPKFDGFYSLELKEFSALFDALYHGARRAEGLKDFVGVLKISNPANIVDWITRSSALPLVTSGQRPLFANPEETLEALLRPEYEPRRFVYLPPEAQSQLAVSAAARSRILSTAFSPHEIDFEIESDGPAMAVIAQSFYGPWRAYVDGEPARVWRANYLFQAVQTPAGKHQVKLAYEDRWFSAGLVVSLLSLGVCVFFRPWRREVKA